MADSSEPISRDLGLRTNTLAPSRAIKPRSEGPLGKLGRQLSAREVACQFLWREQQRFFARPGRCHLVLEAEDLAEAPALVGGVEELADAGK